jgi:hypothetical protein
LPALGLALGRLANTAQVAADFSIFGEHSKQAHSALALYALQNVEAKCALQELSPWPVRATLWRLSRHLECHCTMHASVFTFGSDRLLLRCDLRPQLTRRGEQILRG